MRTTTTLTALTFTALMAVGCGGGADKSASGASNHVQSGKAVDRLIGDTSVSFRAMSADTLEQHLRSGALTSTASAEGRSFLNALPRAEAPAANFITKSQSAVRAAAENPLVLGFPIGLIGEQNVFGGVITKVSDRTNETLGMLKLTDLTPIHVRPLVSANGDDFSLTLVGCPNRCSENSQQVGLINFPIVGISQEDNMVILDLSSVGAELDLVSMMDPAGQVTGLKAISSATTVFDYSLSTLVFDVLTKFIPKAASPDDASAPVTEITVRWYMKLASGFNPAFTARAPTNGVGFFTTERSTDTKITRFSTTNFGQPVKYYIKNVPAQWQPAFAGAFDGWNREFTRIIGRNLLSYEFIPEGDPRNELLVAGDIRYNILEWDLVNKAPYGGLGPSIANQHTGETFSANTLIQGPTIIDLYTRWFALSAQAKALNEQGRAIEAEALMKSFNQSLESKLNPARMGNIRVRLGDALEMTVHASREELEDTLVKNHFEVVPAGVTFEQYMNGYFGEMVAHELGHNIGLRHNFKGNLGASGGSARGSVSRSIMEYMGRPFRHLNTIGLYDRMALAFGYGGTAPTHTDWFCTDEHQPGAAARIATMSAECSKSDATNDPFSFWEGRLSRAIELLVAPSTSEAPVWTLAEINGQVEEVTLGMLAYGANNAATAGSWVAFFGRADRPEAPAEVLNYVLSKIQAQICDPALGAAINAKATPEGRQLALTNLQGLAAKFSDKARSFSLNVGTRLACGTGNVLAQVP